MQPFLHPQISRYEHCELSSLTLSSCIHSSLRSAAPDNCYISRLLELRIISVIAEVNVRDTISVKFSDLAAGW